MYGDITDMMIKDEVIVQSESNILEFADMFCSLAMDGNGVKSGLWCGSGVLKTSSFVFFVGN